MLYKLLLFNLLHYKLSDLHVVIAEVKIAAECLENPATLPKKPTSFVVRCLDHFHQQNNATHAFQSKEKENLMV